MLGVVYLVFHVSLLEPYNYRDSEELLAPFLVILKKSREEYKVNEILDEYQHYS